MRAAGIAFLPLLALFVLVSALPAREPNKQELLVAIEKQLRTANETAGPCVACVVVSRSDRYPKTAGAADKLPGQLGGYTPDEKKKRDPLDLSDTDNIPDHGFACGVVIDSAGLILTPYHVVEGATKVYVQLPGRPGSYADIHAADSRHDLAMLKLITPPEKPLPTLKFGDAEVDGPGQKQTGLANGKLLVHVANGYASGFVLDRPSANLGSITNIRWKVAPDPNNPTKTPSASSGSYYTYGPLIEYDRLSDPKVADAKLNTDVSGAALLNLDGELIGLTTTHATVAGGDRAPGFAFPADSYFRRVVEVLRRGEEVEYGYLGVSLREGGLSIGQVLPNTPADRAGLRQDDVIVGANGTDIKTYGELLHRVGSALTGERVKLTVLRGVERKNITVTLSKFSHEQPFIASNRPALVFGLRIDYGATLGQGKPRNPAEEPRGVPDGVAVREVAPNSPAATAFKKLGDPANRWLITKVNGAAVATPAEFYAATKDQKSVKLTMIDPAEKEKDRKEREVTLP